MKIVSTLTILVSLSFSLGRRYNDFDSWFGRWIPGPQKLFHLTKVSSIQYHHYDDVTRLFKLYAKLYPDLCHVYSIVRFHLVVGKNSSVDTRWNHDKDNHIKEENFGLFKLRMISKINQH